MAEWRKKPWEKPGSVGGPFLLWPDDTAVQFQLLQSQIVRAQLVLPDLSQFLSISNSSEQLDDVTETMNFLFSSTLDTVAPLRLRLRKRVQHRGIMSTLAL